MMSMTPGASLVRKMQALEFSILCLGPTGAVGLLLHIYAIQIKFTMDLRRTHDMSMQLQLTTYIHY